MKCAECDTEIVQSSRQLVQDFLCKRCRAAIEPEIWEERERVTKAVLEWLQARGDVYYGHEITFPKGSPWAWVSVYETEELAEPGNIYDAQTYDHFIKRQYLARYVVWRATGSVYVVESDGAVRDDPIFTPSFA